MSFIIFDGEHFLSFKEDSSIELSSEFKKAARFKSKKSALNVAIRRVKYKEFNWVVFNESKVCLENLLEDFKKFRQAIKF